MIWVPRIVVAKKNFENFSNELNILGNEDLLYDVDNLYIAWLKIWTEERKNKYIMENINICTDGLIINEIYDNLWLFKKEENIWLENIYDIYIIDECHEHNKNIDMIITLLKIIMFLNISIKIV